MMHMLNVNSIWINTDSFKLLIYLFIPAMCFSDLPFIRSVKKDSKESFHGRIANSNKIEVTIYVYHSRNCPNLTNDLNDLFTSKRYSEQSADKAGHLRIKIDI